MLMNGEVPAKPRALPQFWSELQLDKLLNGFQALLEVSSHRSMSNFLSKLDW